jgi:hypothetical protein
MGFQSTWKTGNFYYDVHSGVLNRELLRYYAVRRLFELGRRIDKNRAIELLAQSGCKCARASVEMWISNPRQTF